MKHEYSSLCYSSKKRLHHCWSNRRCKGWKGNSRKLENEQNRFVDRSCLNPMPVVMTKLRITQNFMAGKWIYDMVWWDHFYCFMEIAAPIYTPEGQKAHEKGYHKNLFQVSLESVSFLWSSPLIQLLTCLWYADVLPASKIQPIWFPPHAAWHRPVTRSRRSTHNLSSWHSSLHHVGGLLCQNDDAFILSVILLCLCDKCRLCWRWDFFLSNLWT